ncbi:hypothetical protein LSAT2_021835, partial [Lamellibrachia satsuma]
MEAVNAVDFEEDEHIKMEDTELYQLIDRSTKQSLAQACRLVSSLTREEVQLRSLQDRRTYLHHVVMQATEVYKRHRDLSLLVCLVYRLAVRGVVVNAQNEHGNTALHIACIRPHAQSLCAHLIRIGIDPCIPNKKKIRVIHQPRNHYCELVKGELCSSSGLWKAVIKEDTTMVERLLKCWCRVRVDRNKTLLDIAEESANWKLIRLLERYADTNDLVCVAHACDVNGVKELLATGNVDLEQKDEAWDVPKPLLVSLMELGHVSRRVVEVLKEHGASGVEEYEERMRDLENAFERSEFYSKVEEGTRDSLTEALELIGTSVNVNLVSRCEDTEGWTYLHYVVDRYQRMKKTDEETAVILIRALYRLALAGIDVNARDMLGETALVKAALTLDQNLMAHVIRIVEANDIGKAERWLKSWARVKARKGVRSVMDFAKFRQSEEILRLLEEYEHINEFVCATFACDLKAMMNTIALGRGKKKVNTIDDFFYVGLTHDRHAEFVSRPIIVMAMEICTPEVVDFLLRFGADLSGHYEERAPCGPIAFWAFRDHVSNENALVVSQHADVMLRDEIGTTMLHMAVKKDRREGKAQLLRMLLCRGADVAARDWEGNTPRDYLVIYNIPDADQLQQIIDDHVVELIYNDQWYLYADIQVLHDSTKAGDLNMVSKLAGEKRCGYGRDKTGRTLLHTAVLYLHPQIVRFIVEQFPTLVNSTDNLNRTPLHLCVCLKDRHLVWPILQEGGADPNLVDVVSIDRLLGTVCLCKMKVK